MYKAHHRRTNAVVAIKAISLKKLNRKLQKNLESEIAILQQLQHRHIVRLSGLHKTEGHMFLIMENCEGGDLHKFIRKRGPLEESTTRSFMQQLGVRREGEA